MHQRRSERWILPHLPLLRRRGIKRQSEVSRLCSDVENTHPLHIKPVAALRADDANEHVATSRTPHYRSHAAHIYGERTNRPGRPAIITRLLTEHHFKR